MDSPRLSVPAEQANPSRDADKPHPPQPHFQDTNYIGITINEDDKPIFSTIGKAPSLHTPHSSTTASTSEHRHSFNGFSDRSHLDVSRLPSNIHTSNISNSNSNSHSNINNNKNDNNNKQRQQPHHHHARTHSSSTASTLSRHSSIHLPAINTNLAIPDSSTNKLSFSNAHEPHSATLPLSSPLSPRCPRYSASNHHHLSPHSPVTSSPSLSPLNSSVVRDSLLEWDHFSGAFRKVRSVLELRPPLSLSRHPPNKKRQTPLLAMTCHLNATYQACNDGFRYNAVHNPRRVLTKPSKPAGNDGYDNEDFDYILYVNDILGGSEGHKYIILDVLGAGTFGQVVKCKNEKTQEIVAVKVVKNKMAYFKQSMMEVAILEVLNKRHDPFDKHHILRLKDTFIHRKHLCLVFELLSVNLYELIKQNQFRGLSTNLVRVFTAQILDSLTVLNEARIIHCDLKPENILLKNLESPVIKTIDFGSACHEVQTMYTYIQSRFYRSPEVLAGLPYTSAIDMWSLGCIATELFLGLPLFPGSSEYNQISRIVEMLGVPPNYMIEMGKNAHRYFERYVDEHGQKRYRLKSMEQYSREQGKTEQPSKRYFSAKTLAELINNYPMMRKGSMSAKEIEKEKQNRLAFIDFLQGLLNLNHFERWSPQQAKQHPFITGEKFTGPFKPPYVPRKQQQQQQQQQPQQVPSSSSQSPQTQPLSQPRQGMSSLPTIHDDDTGSSGLSYSYEPIRIHQHPAHHPPPVAFPSTSISSSAAYSSSLPNYYTHNSILHPPRPPRHQDNEPFTQSSLTLPPVLEPPDELSLGYAAPSGPPPPPAPSSRKSFLSIPNVNDPSISHSSNGNDGLGGGRPRANTVGGPPPPPPHHHLYTQQMHPPPFPTVEPYVYPSGDYAEFQGIKVVEPATTLPASSSSSSSSRIREDDPRLMLPLSTKDAFSDQQRWDWGARVADLERDGGDWKDSPRRRMQHAQHRRSNSSIHISELSASAAARSSVANNVANLHRRVRGHHAEPYSRQDIEWDGVNSIPALESDREWRDEKSGWTIA